MFLVALSGCSQPSQLAVHVRGARAGGVGQAEDRKGNSGVQAGLRSEHAQGLFGPRFAPLCCVGVELHIQGLPTSDSNSNTPGG